MKRKIPRLLSLVLAIALGVSLSLQMGPTEVSAKSDSVTPEQMGIEGCIISVNIHTGRMIDDGQIDLEIDTGYSKFNTASMWFEGGDAGLENADTVITDEQASELVANGIQGLTVKMSDGTGIYIHYIKIDFVQYWLKTDNTYGFKTLGEWDYYTGKWFDAGSTTSYGTADTLNYEKVTISTADESNAGTDMIVEVWLKDANGTTSQQVDLYTCTELEQGDVEEIYIAVPQDFTETQKLCMQCWENGSAIGWKIKSIAFEKAGRTITPNVWILEPTGSDYITFGLDPGTTSVFKHVVKTADASKAGTDSNIDFQINNFNINEPSTWSKPLRISDYDHNAGTGNGFERDDTDVFAAAYSGEGWSEVNSLQITKDDSGIGPDWKPEYVELTEIVADDATGNTYRFDINEFIGEGTYAYGKTGITFDYSTVQQTGWQSILENLKDASLIIKTDEGFVLEEAVVQLLKEKGIELKIEFLDGEKSLGIYTIDGKQITSVKNLMISKDLIADTSVENASPKTGDTNFTFMVILFAMTGVLIAAKAGKQRMIS